MSVSIKKYSNFFVSHSVIQINFNEDETLTKTAIENNAKFKDSSVLVFLIDKSGSMSGSPFQLLKESINKLVPLVTESFKKIHFITFESYAKEVTYEEFLTVSASGGTSFNSANLQLIKCLNQYDDSYSFQIVYFTDGEDTSVDFGIIKNFLSKTKKSITFNTCGFGTSHDANLLTKLTQMSLTHGIYKSFKNSQDINFDDFGNLFYRIKTGYLLLENDEKKFFNLNKMNEEFIVVDSNQCSVSNAFIANQLVSIDRFEEKNFDEIDDYNLKITIFNLFLSELFKIEDKLLFVNKLVDYKKYVQANLSLHVSPLNSIFENEFIEECFSELLTSCDNLILDSKSNKEISQLKALTYENILNNKFKKKLDERAIKNQANFQKNLDKVKQIANDNKEKIEAMDVSCFPDKCYITQENFNELLLKNDCLGICFKMVRNGEKVIVNPNFVQINEIGYSSFISLNSVFSVLKYKFDDITKDDASFIHGGFEKNLEAFFLDGTYFVCEKSYPT